MLLTLGLLHLCHGWLAPSGAALWHHQTASNWRVLRVSGVWHWCFDACCPPLLFPSSASQCRARRDAICMLHRPSTPPFVTPSHTTSRLARLPTHACPSCCRKKTIRLELERSTNTPDFHLFNPARVARSRLAVSTKKEKGPILALCAPSRLDMAMAQLYGPRATATANRVAQPDYN